MSQGGVLGTGEVDGVRQAASSNINGSLKQYSRFPGSANHTGGGVILEGQPFCGRAGNHSNYVD